jgi:lipopolysaccharide heptosyltransferase I
MGDIVHALPLAENARRAGVEVGWVTERTYGPLLEGNPAIGRLFLADTKRWRRSPLSPSSRREIRRLRAELLAFAPDATLDVQGLWKSALVARLARAPVVSLGARDRREQSSSILVDHAVRLGDASAHVVDQNLELLAPLSIPVVARAPDASYLLAAPRPEADAFASSLPRPFAMLHPGSSHSRKSWGEERFAALARRLSERGGLTTVISWGPGDEVRAARLAGLTPGSIRIPLLDFAGLAHVISRAALFVGGDTGPVHLADALGVPTVALFSPAATRNVPERNRPYRGVGLRYDPDGVDRIVAAALEAASAAAE